MMSAAENDRSLRRASRLAPLLVAMSLLYLSPAAVADIPRQQFAAPIDTPIGNGAVAVVAGYPYVTADRVQVGRLGRVVGGSTPQFCADTDELR